MIKTKWLCLCCLMMEIGLLYYCYNKCLGSVKLTGKSVSDITMKRDPPKPIRQSKAKPLDTINGGSTTHLSCGNEFQQKHFMTIANNDGRLGNFVFRLFSLLGTARKNCFVPVLDRKKFAALYQTFDLSFINEAPTNGKQIQWKHIKEDVCCRYNAATASLDPSFNWTLAGYLQSWKYFEGHEHYIRSAVTFRPRVKRQASIFLELIRLKSRLIRSDYIIGVHIRRGDYVNNTRGYNVADRKYLRKAMNFYKKKHSKQRLAFAVVSDDILWAKENLKGENVFFGGFSPSVDFAIVALSNHVIITSGSFGYTAAWLNGGYVVYYNGYPGNGTELTSQFRREEYYPPHWLPMGLCN